MTSKVKRPAQISDEKVDALFDKLEKIATSHDKTQFTEALKAIDELRAEAKETKEAGSDTKDFDRELKRQENRHKMDEMDSKALQKMKDDKKDGTDQVSVARNEPADAPRPAPVADEGGCTIGEPGKFLFVAGAIAALVYLGVQAYRSR